MTKEYSMEPQMRNDYVQIDTSERIGTLVEKYGPDAQISTDVDDYYGDTTVSVWINFQRLETVSEVQLRVDIQRSNDEAVAKKKEVARKRTNRLKKLKHDEEYAAYLVLKEKFKDIT